MKILKFIYALLFTFSLSGQLHAQDTLKTYIFGHSLINHSQVAQINPTPSQETSVPHWFYLLAKEVGENYAVSGQFGFMGGHANNLPPSAQWGFDSVPAAWDDNVLAFSSANFDNIMVTPGNFMQWQPAHVNYWGENHSPLSSTNVVFDWVNQQEDSLKLYVYENWPDMASYLANNFPPSPSEWAQYNNYLNGGFHDWFVEYYDSLVVAHPNHCVRMIPTGPAISSLLMQAPFNQIPIDTLYEDDAPHGRATIYFLAALVTYMAMYEQPAPLTYQVPGIIDTTIANNYPAVVNHIWNELVNFNDSLGNSMVFCTTLATNISKTKEAATSVSIYPNPTSNHIAIQRSTSEEAQITIRDNLGRMMKSIKSTNFVEHLNLSSYPPGIYYVTIQENKKLSTHKILLQK